MRSRSRTGRNAGSSPTLVPDFGGPFRSTRSLTVRAQVSRLMNAYEASAIEGVPQSMGSVGFGSSPPRSPLKRGRQDGVFARFLIVVLG